MIDDDKLTINTINTNLLLCWVYFKEFFGVATAHLLQPSLVQRTTATSI